MLAFFVDTHRLDLTEDRVVRWYEGAIGDTNVYKVSIDFRPSDDFQKEWLTEGAFIRYLGMHGIVSNSKELCSAGPGKLRWTFIYHDRTEVSVMMDKFWEIATS